MNIELKRVGASAMGSPMKRRGTKAHCMTRASPPLSSTKKIRTLRAINAYVTSGKLLRALLSSPIGNMSPHSRRTQDPGWSDLVIRSGRSIAHSCWRHSRPRQETSEIRGRHDVVSQAEPGPPDGHPGVRNHAAMNEIEQSMRGQGAYDDPQIPLEAESGKTEEDGDDDALADECPVGSAHDRKEAVVRCDDDHHGWVEGAVSVQADEGSRQTDRQRKDHTDPIFHAPSCQPSWGETSKICRSGGRVLGSFSR